MSLPYIGIQRLRTYNLEQLRLLVDPGNYYGITSSVSINGFFNFLLRVDVADADETIIIQTQEVPLTNGVRYFTRIFDGTWSVWEERLSIAGPRGLTGETGATGPAGGVGPTGATGPTGPGGAAGADGIDGLSIQGSKGATGSGGATGPKGLTGAAGRNGAAGAGGRTVNISVDHPSVHFTTNGLESTTETLLFTATPNATMVGTKTYLFRYGDANTPIADDGLRGSSATHSIDISSKVYGDFPLQVVVWAYETNVLVAIDQMAIIGQKAGSDVITVVMPNNNASVLATVGGVVDPTALIAAFSSDMWVAQGITDLAYVATLTGPSQWMITSPIEVTPAGAITVGIPSTPGTHADITDYTAFAAQYDACSVRFNIAYKNSEGTDGIISVVQTLNKTRDGVDGYGALSCIISKPSVVLPASADGLVPDLAYGQADSFIVVKEGLTTLSYAVDEMDIQPGEYVITGPVIDPAGEITANIDTTDPLAPAVTFIAFYGTGVDSVVLVYTINGFRQDGTAFTDTIQQIIVKGKAGIDGTSVEWIYLTSNIAPDFVPTPPATTPIPPVAPTPNVDDDNNIPTSDAWTDDYANVTETLQYGYSSRRIKANGTWGDWGTPYLWAKWAADGIKGIDGHGVEYIFYRSTNGSPNGDVPTAPVDPVYPFIETGEWYQDPQEVTPSFPHLYQSHRKILGDVPDGLFTVPILWNKYVTNGGTGNPGAAGAAAITVEIDKQVSSMDANENDVFALLVYLKVLRGTTYLTPGVDYTITRVVTGLTVDVTDNAPNKRVEFSIEGFANDTTIQGTCDVEITIGAVVIHKVITVNRIIKAIIIPRGDWSASVTDYVGNTHRREVVYHAASSSWYISLLTAGAITTGAVPSTSHTLWEAMTTYENIATDVLFANSAWIGIQTGNKILMMDSAGVVVGGMTGAVDSDSAIRFWLGATEMYNGSAPIRMTQGGKIFLADAEISGTVSTSPVDKRIELNAGQDALIGYNAAGAEIVKIDPQPVITQANLDVTTPVTETMTYPAEVIECPLDGNPIGLDFTTVGALVLVAGQLYTIVTPEIAWDSEATGHHDGLTKIYHEAWARVTVRLTRTNTPSAVIWTEEHYSYSNTDSIHDMNGGAVLSRTLLNMPAGTYAMTVVAEVTLGTGCVGLANIARAICTLTGTTNVGASLDPLFHIGSDGFNFVQAFAKYFHYNLADGLVYKGPSDMPGLLVSASVAYATLVQSNVWGAKKNPANISEYATGEYSIPHLIGHTAYQIMISPLATTARTHRITLKSDLGFRVRFEDLAGNAIATNFDYILVGTNVAP